MKFLKKILLGFLLFSLFTGNVFAAATVSNYWSRIGSVVSLKTGLTLGSVTSSNIITDDLTVNDVFTFGGTMGSDLNMNGYNIIGGKQVKFSTGQAITATDYAIVRDADATNQLHLNVPTGASVETSINDVAKTVLDTSNLTMNTGLKVGTTGVATALDPQKNSNIFSIHNSTWNTTGGGSEKKEYFTMELVSNSGTSINSQLDWYFHRADGVSIPFWRFDGDSLNIVPLVGMRMGFNQPFLFGDVGDALRYNTQQTNPVMTFEVNETNRTVNLIDSGDSTYNFATPTFPDPSYVFHSHNQSTDQYGYLNHNGINATLGSAKGGIVFTGTVGAIGTYTTQIDFTSSGIADYGIGAPVRANVTGNAGDGSNAGLGGFVADYTANGSPSTRTGAFSSRGAWGLDFLSIDKALVVTNKRTTDGNGYASYFSGGEATSIGTPAGSNQYTDGALDVWTDPSTLTNWIFASPLGGIPTIAQEATIRHTASGYSATITVDGSGNPGYLYQAITGETPGTTYQVTAWIRDDGSSSDAIIILFNDVYATATEMYNFTTNAWVAIGSPSPDTLMSLTCTTNFQQLDSTSYGNFTIPANGKVYAYIGANFGTPAGVVQYYDDVSFNTPAIAGGTYNGSPIYVFGGSGANGGTNASTFLAYNGSAAIGNVAIGTGDMDGTPAIGRLTIKGSTNDGSTNIIVGRDSDEANVFTLDTNGGMGITAMLTNWTNAGRTVADLGNITTVDINGGTLDAVTIGGSTAGAITGTTITGNTGFVPDANDGAYLGQAGTAFSDLFLASGGVINWDSGDVTITHSANFLNFGGAIAYIFDGVLVGNGLVGNGLDLPHTVNKVASANARNTHTADATSTSATYVKAKTITFTNGLLGQQRFVFDIKTSNILSTAYGRLYKNGCAGTPVGIEQTTASLTDDTKSEDITQTWNPQDTLDLCIHIDGSETVTVNDLKVEYDDAPTVTVASANS